MITTSNTLLLCFGCCLHTAKAGRPAVTIALASFRGLEDLIVVLYGYLKPPLVRSEQSIHRDLHVSEILCSRQLAIDMLLLWSDSYHLSNTSAKSLSQQEHDNQWMHGFGHPSQAHLNNHTGYVGYVTVQVYHVHLSHLLFRASHKVLVTAGSVGGIKPQIRYIEKNANLGKPASQ